MRGGGGGAVYEITVFCRGGVGWGVGSGGKDGVRHNHIFRV